MIHLYKGATTFTGLTDTPANFTSQGGKFVKVKSDGTQLIFESLTVPDDFTDLTDTPANYSNAASYFVKVKSDSTGLEFVTHAFLSNINAENLTDLVDVTPVTSSNDDDILYYDHASTSFKWKKYELKTLIDLDTPGSSENSQGLYWDYPNYE